VIAKREAPVRDFSRVLNHCFCGLNRFAIAPDAELDEVTSVDFED